MDLTRNLFVLAIGGVILFLTVRSLRAGRLKERYALLYIFLSIPFLALAVWREAMGWAAEQLAIDYRTLSLMLVTTFVVVMNLKLLSMLSVQERKITELAQRVGMMGSIQTPPPVDKQSDRT